MPSSDAEVRIAAQEARLIAQIAAGYLEEPLQKLCRRYERNLYRFGVHMLGDEGLAEELVQQSFQRLWRSAGRYDARQGRPSAFLFVLARSAAADTRRRRSSRTPLPAEEIQLPPLPGSVDQILDSLTVRETLGKLSSPHAEILRLTFEENLTPSEVAERLATPLGTIKIRMFHGMRALRSALEEPGIDASDGQIDLAHPEAAYRALGILDPAESREFQRHLPGCCHCHLAVTEFSRIGRILRHLPPAVEPPPDLKARTIAGVMAAASGGAVETPADQIPGAAPAAAGPGTPAQAIHGALAPPELASLYHASPGPDRPHRQMAKDDEPAPGSA